MKRSPVHQTQAPLSIEALWKAVLAETELEVSRANFHTWFRKTALSGIDDGVAKVHVPNNFAREWLEAKYRRFLLKTLRSYNSDIRDILFAVGKLTSSQQSAESSSRSQLPSLPLSRPAQHESGLNPRYAFQAFIVGNGNELAHAAALSVTKQPGTLYNPLFIYGPVGLGKTHLLQAIGNHFLLEYPSDFKIRYISSERFIRDLISAIKTRTTERFKTTYRSVDVLLIDDVQFIAGKETTQEELFHTFNELSDRGAQIVFSSDRPPHAIPELEDRLRSRFEGGMIADIQPPDFETRVAILYAKARERDVKLSEEVAHAIAGAVERNIRELEGALNRVVQQEIIDDQGKGDAKRVHEALRTTLPAPQRTTFKEILDCVGRYYDLKQDEIFEKSRRQEIVRPRQVAMFLARDLLSMSYPAIGKRFRNLDHTTVIHACDRIKNELSASGPISEEIAGIREMLAELTRG
jgi:chromosomal replication initiator protein